jgi:hypothetical protein
MGAILPKAGGDEQRMRLAYIKASAEDAEQHGDKVKRRTVIEIEE